MAAPVVACLGPMGAAHGLGKKVAEELRACQSDDVFYSMCRKSWRNSKALNASTKGKAAVKVPGREGDPVVHGRCRVRRRRRRNHVYSSVPPSMTP